MEAGLPLFAWLSQCEPDLHICAHARVHTYKHTPLWKLAGRRLPVSHSVSLVSLSLNEN